MRKSCQVYSVLFAVQCLDMPVSVSSKRDVPPCAAVVQLDGLVVRRGHAKLTAIIIIQARNLAVGLYKFLKHLSRLERGYKRKRQRDRRASIAHRESGGQKCSGGLWKMYSKDLCRRERVKKSSHRIVKQRLPLSNFGHALSKGTCSFHACGCTPVGGRHRPIQWWSRISLGQLTQRRG